MSKQAREEQILLLGQLFEKLIAVNGFFITAGYGAFFGVWALAKDHLTPGYTITSCLFLLASATLFVGWHFTGMLSLMESMRPKIGRFGRMVSLDPRRTRVRLAMLAGRLVQKGGFSVMLVTAGTALAGLAVLFVGLIRSLGA